MHLAFRLLIAGILIAVVTIVAFFAVMYLYVNAPTDEARIRSTISQYRPKIPGDYSLEPSVRPSDVAEEDRRIRQVAPVFFALLGISGLLVVSAGITAWQARRTRRKSYPNGGAS